MAATNASPVDDAVTSTMRDDHVLGASVAILKGDQVVSVHGYGLSEKTLRRPATGDTAYEIGSVTREFTNVAILQLKEAGKLDLDAPIGRYLRDAPHASQITVRALLTDTSGLQPYVDGSDLDAHGASTMSEGAVMSRLAAEPLASLPDGTSQYSISDPFLLARIVEALSGQTWGAYLASHLFAPAGMTRSSTIAQRRSVAGMARGYRYANDAYALARELNDTWVVGSGDVITTATDLAKWRIALDSGRLVSRDDANIPALTEVVQGDTFGFDAADVSFANDGLRVIVLTNTTNDIPGQSGAVDIAQAVDAAVLAQSAPTTPTAVRSFYEKATERMDEQRQPPFVTYTLHGKGDNEHISLMDLNRNIWLRFQGGGGETVWSIQHRTQDYASSVLEADGTRYVSRRPLFDPTWFGAFRALRDGMLGFQDDSAPRTSLTIAQPTSAPASSLHTIASTNVIGPGLYSVQDRGDATCTNGDPGRALHFISRNGNRRRELSDIIVDLHSMRFCSIRYGWTEPLFFTGFIEQHYAEVGGYWVETDGLIDGTPRVFGIKTNHFVWKYTLDDITFPTSLPNATFIPDSKQ